MSMLNVQIYNMYLIYACIYMYAFNMCVCIYMFVFNISSHFNSVS